MVRCTGRLEARNLIICTNVLYNYNEELEDNTIKCECNVWKKSKGNMLVEKPKIKSPFATSRCRWENNIRMHLKKMEKMT